MIKKIFTFFLIFISLSSYLYASEEDSQYVFQDSIDKYFEEVDTELEDFLTQLNKDKNFCFGKYKTKNFTECVDLIYKAFSINGEFASKYQKSCIEILKETIEKEEGKQIPAKEAKDFLSSKSNKDLCTRLYSFKLSIYQSTAIDIMKKNKYAVNRDEHKLFTQQVRTKYDKLIDLIRVNVGYIERIWKKWPSKTKK